MSSSPDHKAVVRQEFTQQAQAYAANPMIMAQTPLSRLVEAVHPRSDARVLDVATGPGYVAAAFAEAGCEVVGLDLTEAPLALAEQMRQQRGLANLSFQVGDAEQLPFADQSFDVVVSRFALHHCEDAQRVLAEMARVCRLHGTVVIEDLVTSEFPKRAAYQNRMEYLRDPSHTRALSISEFLAIFSACGLEVEQIYTDFRPQVLEQWLKNTQTPDEPARQVRTLMEQDEQHNLSGLRLFRQDGALHFYHRTATLISHKLAVSLA